MPCAGRPQQNRVDSILWKRRLAGWGAALFWILLCLRWFDAGAPWRPAWLGRTPSGVVALAAAVSFALWLRGHWAAVAGVGEARWSWLIPVGLALAFRVPAAIWGAAGYTTADGALSGIVCLHLRDGRDHLVFVPHVPYSGSLKSHLAAPLAALMDPSRAFTLTSLAFYGLFVAGLYPLARRTCPKGLERSTALGAGLYAAFAPTFVTHYSLSNDGNYVEVLALGTWALLLATRWLDEPQNRGILAVWIGLLLGLGFWCHILAALHVAAILLALLAGARWDAVKVLPSLACGFALGYFPGLLWNAQNSWDSFRYVLPGGESVGSLAEGPGLARRAFAMVTDQWPVLMGYDRGYSRILDLLSKTLAWVGVVTAAACAGVCARSKGRSGKSVLFLFLGTNLLVALLSLPLIPGNPRYELFLIAPISIFLAQVLQGGWKRGLLVLLVVFGALGSISQAIGELEADERWRGFVSALEREGVHWCHTDFYLATKINFLSQERIICSAKLGPTTTEYFFEYRRTVEQAREAALIPVNRTAASRLERRLRSLGVSYERLDLMKPVLLRLGRKVEPEELFPGREFPLR